MFAHYDKERTQNDTKSWAFSSALARLPTHPRQSHHSRSSTPATFPHHPRAVTAILTTQSTLAMPGPCVMSVRTTSTLPVQAARWSGVEPRWSARFTDASCDISRATTSLAGGRGQQGVSKGSTAGDGGHQGVVGVSGCYQRG